MIQVQVEAEGEREKSWRGGELGATRMVEGLLDGGTCKELQGYQQGTFLLERGRARGDVPIRCPFIQREGTCNVP